MIYHLAPIALQPLSAVCLGHISPSNHGVSGALPTVPGAEVFFFQEVEDRERNHSDLTASENELEPILHRPIDRPTAVRRRSGYNYQIDQVVRSRWPSHDDSGFGLGKPCEWL